MLQFNERKGGTSKDRLSIKVIPSFASQSIRLKINYCPKAFFESHKRDSLDPNISELQQFSLENQKSFLAHSTTQTKTCKKQQKRERYETVGRLTS